MNKQELINNLLSDLAQDAPISKVMLMAQAISFELKNKKYSNWVRNEQRGYKDGEDIPNYREVQCILKVDIFLPFQGIMTNFTIPTDLIKDQMTRNFISTAKLALPLSELEEISKKNQGGDLRLGVPGSLFPILDSVLTKGNVQRAYRSFSATAPKTIINCVKAKMLDYFSFLCENVNIEENFESGNIQTTLDQLFDKYIWND